MSVYLECGSTVMMKTAGAVRLYGVQEVDFHNDGYVMFDEDGKLFSYSRKYVDRHLVNPLTTLENTKIKANNDDERREIQELVFKAGVQWFPGGMDVNLDWGPFYYIDDEYGSELRLSFDTEVQVESYRDFVHKEITLPQLREYVERQSKEGDIKSEEKPPFSHREPFKKACQFISSVILRGTLSRIYPSTGKVVKPADLVMKLDDARREESEQEKAYRLKSLPDVGQRSDDVNPESLLIIAEPNPAFIGMAFGGPVVDIEA